MDTLCCIKIHFKNEVVEAGIVVEVGAVKKQGKVEIGENCFVKKRRIYIQVLPKNRDGGFLRERAPYV